MLQLTSTLTCLMVVCIVISDNTAQSKPTSFLQGEVDTDVEANNQPIDCTTREDDGGRQMQARNGVINPRYRWTNFKVFVDPSYDSRDRTRIQDAMDKLADVLPCVNFEVVPPGSQPSGDYVHIVKGSGCWSYVGRLGGKQQLSLQSPGCTGVGTIMHEMIHALGFYHEQSRPDRDDYVNILWDNISPGMENNFVKRSASQVTTFGVPYNTRSIMHYSSRAFSKNGQPTITAKSGEPINPSQSLESTDIQKLKLMYNC